MVRRAAGGAFLLSTMLFLYACSSDADPTTASTTRPRSSATPDPGRPVASPGCERRVPARPGVSDRTLMSGGVERVFQLDVPESYAGVTPVPVVFGLHSLTVSHTLVPGIGGFADMRDRSDFVAVFPSGRLAGTIPYWHAAPSRDNYDVAFFEDLLDLLATELCIDLSRVYATGMSNGGQMSSLLACRLSERFAAVAPIAGAEFYEECDGRPVPVVAFHGSADPIVPYDGGGLDATTISSQSYWRGEPPVPLPEHLGVDEAMRRWAAHNGCDAEPAEREVSPEVRKRTWRGCAAETVLYVVDGGGHSWPGRPVPGFENAFGHTTTDIDATELMFAFFFDASERPPDPR